MEVMCSTSSSVEHPPQSMLDGDPRTFFATTGCFPHEVIIRLSGKTSMGRLKIVSTGSKCRCKQAWAPCISYFVPACFPPVKRFAVDRSDGASASNWQQFVETDVGDPDALQSTSLATPPTPATHLRLRILAGYKEFITIRSFEAQLAS